MFKQRSGKVALVVIALLAVWLLWPSYRPDEPAAEIPESTRLESQPVSSIEPITLAEAASNDAEIAPESDVRIIREKLAKRFATVNQMIADNQSKSAIDELNSMIDEYPVVIEPYINLAALYSKSNRLELARQTLNKGIRANENTELLFASRQAVLGEQAARAYKQALNEPEVSGEAVLLPFISSIDVPTTVVENQSSAKFKSQVDRLKGQLSDLQLERDQLTQSKRSLEKDKVDLERANGQLELEKNSFVENKVSFDQYKTNLEQDKSSLEGVRNSLEQRNAKLVEDNETLETQNRQFIKSEDQLTEQKDALEQERSRLDKAIGELKDVNQSLVAKNEELELANAELAKGERVSADKGASKDASDKNDSLQLELAAAKLALEESQKALSDSQTAFNQLEQQQQSELAKLRQQLADNDVVADNEIETIKQIDTTSSKTTTAKTVSQTDKKPASRREAAPEQQSQAVVEIVKRWAADWSSQNVDGYVSHYTENYTPPRASLTREQWLEQRKIRLTNKTFIKVDVSDFRSQNRGDKFVVTFSQHYRSNTVDDKIVKRLVFVKPGDDWSRAKIVDEVVVSR